MDKNSNILIIIARVILVIIVFESMISYHLYRNLGIVSTECNVGENAEMNLNSGRTGMSRTAEDACFQNTAHGSHWADAQY